MVVNGSLQSSLHKQWNPHLLVIETTPTPSADAQKSQVRALSQSINTVLSDGAAAIAGDRSAGGEGIGRDDRSAGDASVVDAAPVDRSSLPMPSPPADRSPAMAAAPSLRTLQSYI
ncbi:hypothetical protein B9Z55_026714 [Caenorhabditis nigoni]|uniref:Uncharacterized protein n=1 Tax=Caenorhabditis nigoni TaxID=1611254 RepID=A0A2G5SHK1_9PELO|nr:hypothetical protein B9Z55_026714 [Caenorhabditis nigoni]